MIFFTSDTHFYSDKVLLREHRPFSSTLQMNHVLQCNFNQQMTKNDTLYVIGDFGSHDENFERSYKIARLLNAKVILVCGNTEEKIINKHFSGSFKRFREWCLLHDFEDVIHKKAIVKDLKRDKLYELTHVPTLESEHTPLYGHFHKSPGMWVLPGLNVAVDSNHFYALSMTNVADMLVYQEYSKDSMRKHFPTIDITISKEK